MIRFSTPSKVPCKTWSLQALDTCLGSKGSDGNLVPACEGCYATTGHYHMPNVKEPRVHNREDWKREGWVSEFVTAIQKDKYFRWFDSGDIYDLRLAKKMLDVMRLTPGTKHWLPTRMHKFSKYKDTFTKMEALTNVVVRYSSDSISGGIIEGANSSTIIPDPESKTSASICNSYKTQGKCKDCRNCWDKSIKVIAYPAHGRKMLKIIATSS